uniref:Arrestin_C domain-containing protein n=1 Tax=Caenorhabditis japonica TaxID=281687 RepID=A0A8R1HZJ8_CAEJA
MTRHSLRKHKYLQVNLPKRGYVPGEVIPITISIDNGSRKPIATVSAKMIQMSNFHATRGHSTHVHDPMATGYTNPYHKQRSAEKIVGESRMNVNVAPHMKQQVVLSLKIPAIAPSFQCPIMNANYSLTVKMDAQGLLGTSLKCEFPLIIGTIPIRQTVLPAGSASSSTVPAALPMKVVSSGSPYPVMGEGSSAGPVYPSAPPSTVFPSAPAYPGMGQGASVYPSAPSAPSAPPDSPTFGGAGISTVAAPPSYEETMHSGGVSQPFVPSYPVYQNLEQSMAPPLPEKPGGF